MFPTYSIGGKTLILPLNWSQGKDKFTMLHRFQKNEIPTWLMNLTPEAFTNTQLTRHELLRESL
jgi:hypothetical protein